LVHAGSSPVRGTNILNMLKMNNTDLNLATCSVGLPGESIAVTDLSSIANLTINTEGICSSPYTYSNYTISRLPMSKELYLYITGGKTCVSTMPPTWNEQEKCLWHAKGSRVLSIEGNYGLSCLIKSYIGSELDIIYIYLTINGFNVYATTS